MADVVIARALRAGGGALIGGVTMVTLVILPALRTRTASERLAAFERRRDVSRARRGCR